MATDAWVDVCGVDDVEEEDVVPIEHNGHAYAVYRSPEGTYHATDGLCTHEHAYLADGYVMGDLIECPKHNGRFNYKTGEAVRAPVCVPVRTYDVKVHADRVFISLR